MKKVNQDPFNQTPDLFHYFARGFDIPWKGKFLKKNFSAAFLEFGIETQQ